jgi:hypothetical protein
MNSKKFDMQKPSRHAMVRKYVSNFRAGSDKLVELLGQSQDYIADLEWALHQVGTGAMLCLGFVGAVVTSPWTDRRRRAWWLAALARPKQRHDRSPWYLQ